MNTVNTRLIPALRAAFALTVAAGALGGLTLPLAPAPAAYAQEGKMESKMEGKMAGKGEFHKLAHKTVGKATVAKGGKGQRSLRLTNFETGKGPKLHVYLLAASDVSDNDAVKKLVGDKMFVDLGDLKKVKGDQSYAIPENVDLSKYGTAVIWCDQFKVSFGAAPLAM